MWQDRGAGIISYGGALQGSLPDWEQHASLHAASPPPPSDSRPATRKDMRAKRCEQAQPYPDAGLAHHGEPQSSCSSTVRRHALSLPR